MFRLNIYDFKYPKHSPVSPALSPHYVKLKNSCCKEIFNFIFIETLKTIYA